MYEKIKIPTFLMSMPLGTSTAQPNNAWMKALPKDERKFNFDRGFRQIFNVYKFLTNNSIVYLLPTTLGLQDQIYVANLGIVLPHLNDADHVVVANFRSPPRKKETEAGVRFFKTMNYKVTVAPQYFEGEADLKWIGGNVYAGAYGTRTSANCLRWLHQTFDMTIVPCLMTHKKLYHLDCVLFPIADRKVVVSEAATSPEFRRMLERHAEIIPVGAPETFGSITNSLRCGNFVLNNTNIEELKAGDAMYEPERKKISMLTKISAKLGLEPVFFNLSEFDKSGADLSCMVMHLNWISQQ